MKRANLLPEFATGVAYESRACALFGTSNSFVGWVYPPTIRVTRQIGGRVHPPHTLLNFTFCRASKGIV